MYFHSYKYLFAELFVAHFINICNLLLNACNCFLFYSEGDRKAYYESAEWTMKQNKERIAKLRKENKELHKLKADRLAVSVMIKAKCV